MRNWSVHLKIISRLLGSMAVIKNSGDTMLIKWREEGNVLFIDAFNILFMVIWRHTYGKGPLR